MAMGYDEGQQLLQSITGAPPGGPEKPSWFGSISSPEWKNFENYQEMQTQMQRAMLMKALDEKFHPLSLEDASRYTGIPMEHLANPSQMGPTGTDISYEPSIIEGPRPMGTRPGFGPKIGERRGEPGEYVTNPDELFPNAMQDTPHLYMGMNQDFFDKKPPYYEPGQLISQHATVDEPVQLQGPGAPVEGPSRMIERPTGYGPNPSAPADWVQRGLTESMLAQKKLRPPAPPHETEAEHRLRMAREYYLDPEGHKAEGVVSGAINTERQVRGTESQSGLNEAKKGNLEAQTRATNELLGVRKDNLKQQSAKLRQQISEMKDTEGIRKEKLQEQSNLLKVMQGFYNARLEGKSADLALKEANFRALLNAEQLKELKGQLSFLHEVKPDLSDEDIDHVIQGLGERFGIKNISKSPSLMERIGGLFSDEPAKPDAEVGDVPMPAPKTAPETGSSGSMRYRERSQQLVPNPPPPSTPEAQDAGALLKQMESELQKHVQSTGKVPKDGTTVTDPKTKRKAVVQGGKLVWSR